MRRLFNEFFKNVIYKAVFVLGVIYAVFTVVKILLDFGNFDILILYVSLIMIGGPVYFQKKANVKETRQNLKRAADEIKTERERAELLKRKSKDAEIDTAADRYDEIDSEAALTEIEVAEEDDFKAMFGFLSVKLKNVFGYFCDGGLYDKFMCAAIILAVFAIFEPYSLYSRGGIPFFLFELAYLLLAIVWCGGEFWLPVGVPLMALKAYFQPIALVITVTVSIIAALLVLCKMRVLSTAPPKPVNAETPKSPKKPTTLQSRFGEEEYDASLMMYSEAFADLLEKEQDDEE